MLIRLLGPVELEREARIRQVRPPQVALALAALAWEVGRVVPVETLQERIWGEQVPDGARKTLYTIITQLRHDVLGDDGDVLRRLGGYLLDVDETAVDLVLFRGLAERAAAVPEPEAPLGEALGLWRGEPLMGLPGEWAERARRALRDEHKEVCLRWARAVTRADPGPAVAALSPLAEEYPLDEPVAAALIEALHEWGRTAEALTRFADVRALLAEELGVDPGPELHRVHQRLLHPDQGVRAAKPLAPAQLPLDLDCFVGRAAELERLDGERAPVRVIHGPPGVGKSSLALRWAHLHREHYPDGQLHADLDASDAAAVLPRFLGSLGVPEGRVPASLDAQIGLFRSVLSGRRVLVVLDGARDAAQVRPLLAGAPGCLTLITTRSDLSGLSVTSGASLLRLDVLPDGDARGLLSARLGTARLSAEPEAAGQIVRRCGRLPLALAIVAARLSRRTELSLADTAADLARPGLEPFVHADPAIDLRRALGRSYHDLPEPAARLFRLLGRESGAHLSLAAVASLAGLPVDRARETVDRLDHANLVELRAEGRVRLHDLLRVYAAEQGRAADDQEVRQEATRRLLDHYVHTALSASDACYPHRERLHPPPPVTGVVVQRFAGATQALRWFAAESPPLPALLAEATGAGLNRHTWQLAWAFSEFMQRRGPWAEILNVQAVALSAAERLDDGLAAARCHNATARAHVKLGHDREAVAHFERALELHRRFTEPALEAHVHLGLTVPLSRIRPGRELEHAVRAMELFRQGGDVVGEARALNNAGWWRAQRGEYEQALADCRRAQRLLAEFGYPQGEGHAWDSVAYVLDAMGHHAEAVACYERAAELLRGCDDLYPAAETLVRLGETHALAGEAEAALDAWKRAAEWFDELGDARAEEVREQARALRNR
ncbi:BTAD domain-containing putative transcriptional regulator [Nonomuraea spiralis]|uniref:BTAD domain-containing putative transcriptional regulator n=1 Tax=Nonomuraea spiralis TaxID=46182 RepID=A0ABV5IVG9_9ACTN|nr:BTAD domain-containing putative transcriptional regulator [Nonomuraea spiralis]